MHKLHFRRTCTRGGHFFYGEDVVSTCLFSLGDVYTELGTLLALYEIPIDDIEAIRIQTEEAFDLVYDSEAPEDVEGIEMLIAWYMRFLGSIAPGRREASIRAAVWGGELSDPVADRITAELIKAPA